MKNNNIFKFNHIYFIGIGGISMSGMAKLLHNMGYNISGSDIAKSHITSNFEKSGVVVYYNHNAENIKNSVDLVVYSGAINLKNPELNYAISNNILVMERSQFLGVVASHYKHVISVSGTHGKTTTTALLGDIFINAGYNPTIHVGGEVVGKYDNFRIGGSAFFITEACEYKKSMEKLFSETVIITNIEKDHMDCYRDINDIYNSFNNMLKNTKKTAIIGLNEAGVKKVIHKNIITCGHKKSVYKAKNLTKNKYNMYSFDVFKHDKKIARYKLNIMGKYNVKNALLAVSCAYEYGIPHDVIYKSLYEFKGIKRRNEKMGDYKNIPVFADYAHHPTEIKSSLVTYESIFKNVLCVFQPHTYSRTLALKNEFRKCFENCEKLVVFKTYPAREDYMVGGDGIDLYKAVVKNNDKKFYVDNYKELKNIVDNNLDNVKAIIVLGAGDLYDHISEIFNIQTK